MEGEPKVRGSTIVAETELIMADATAQLAGQQVSLVHFLPSSEARLGRQRAAQDFPSYPFRQMGTKLEFATVCVRTDLKSGVEAMFGRPDVVPSLDFGPGFRHFVRRTDTFGTGIVVPVAYGAASVVHCGAMVTAARRDRPGCAACSPPPGGQPPEMTPVRSIRAAWPAGSQRPALARPVDCRHVGATLPSDARISIAITDRPGTRTH